MSNDINFEDLRNLDEDDILDIPLDLPLGEQIEEVFRNVALLPYPDLQFPVLTAYCCSPITLATTVGICFLWGRSGLGKSQVLAIASDLYNYDPITAGSTYASLRNHIQGRRWYNPEFEENEKNFILAWDDIKPSVITDSDAMLSLFKIVNRKASKITISSQTPGQNIVFDGFSLRVISSIHPVWTVPELVELKRRIFPIYFKHINMMLPEEKEGNTKELSELYMADNLSVKHYYKELERFWLNIDNCLQYRNNKKSLKRRKHDMENNQFQLSLDVMSAYSVLFDRTLDETLDLFTNYWKMVNTSVLSLKSGTEQWLDKFLADQVEKTEKENSKAIEAGCPELVAESTDIDPKALKEGLKRAKDEGYLDTAGTVKEVNDLMKIRGYSLTINDGQSKWRKII